MRTRLDEIVDEELAAFPELRGQPCGGRIAERAFAHGAEQCQKNHPCTVGPVHPERRSGKDRRRS